MTAKLPFHLLRSAQPEGGQSGEDLLRYQAEFTLNTVARQKHAVYQIDDSSLRPPTEKRSHWSVAWSDLMMTMFILFLSLFVYQAAHKEYLTSDTNEVVAGTTRTALDIEKTTPVGVPFVSIEAGAPLITSGTVKKVETVTLREIDLEGVFDGVDSSKTVDELAQVVPAAKKNRHTPAATAEKAMETASLDGAGINGLKKIVPANPVEIPETILQPQPITAGAHTQESSVNDLFNESRRTVAANDLDKFAAIDLIPDKAMHIVLTGDLLFDTGYAALSAEAILSLEKIAAVIQKSPHQIRIEGHTDDVPIASGQYANNWELSVARANAVANFLIEDMGMDPKQFVISGYASYKPVVPNNSATNRAANRRVEIVIAQPGRQQNIVSTDISNTVRQTL